MDNETFLKVIFREEYLNAHVTSFTEDPSNIPTVDSARCWAGGAYGEKKIITDSNQYYTVSLFNRCEEGKTNRRKKNFNACYVVGLDDVKEKLPLEQVNRLPKPSIVLKSSLHSEQWLYLLSTPETNADRIDNLHDGLIKNGLAPNSKDPGQKGVTRYLRLPDGVNTKQSRIDENGGTPYQCEIIEFHPERKYTLEQLATPFEVDLDAARTIKSDNASDISDHPLLHTDAIKIKKVLSDGRFDITCPWVDEHTGASDSGTAIFTNADGTLGFKCHHGACEERTGGDLLTFIEEHYPGFNERLKSWQLFRELTPVKTESSQSVESYSPWGALSAMGVNDDIEELEKRMLSDKFVLRDLAILGQFTVFYAAPNTGKTLMSLWLLHEAVTSGEMNGKDIFYANCDDTFKGAIEKAKIARDTGFTMLTPNEKGFKSEMLLRLMEESAESGDASGKVLVIDTLKKFAETNDKKLASKFGKLARNFVSAGGTLIALAHVNKHKDGEGKSVYSGTADVRDDSDCCYVIELVGKQESWDGTSTHTVKFENNKARGDVAQVVSFSYQRKKGMGYRSLFDSVQRLSNDQAEKLTKEAELVKQQENDADAIEAITTAIVNGKHSKREIEEFVYEISDLPRQRMRTVLDRYAGRLWVMTRGLHNVHSFTLNQEPEPPVSFF